MGGQIIPFLVSWGPLWFGLGFLAPLVAQSMDAMSIPAPLGLSSISFGLLIGFALGVAAKQRGSWI